MDKNEKIELLESIRENTRMSKNEKIELLKSIKNIDGTQYFHTEWLENNIN